MTRGSFDSEGEISVRDSILTKRRGVPWRLPKLDKIRCVASSSSAATISIENSWSVRPLRNVPLAR